MDAVAEESEGGEQHSIDKSHGLYTSSLASMVVDELAELKARWGEGEHERSDWGAGLNPLQRGDGVSTIGFIEEVDGENEMLLGSLLVSVHRVLFSQHDAATPPLYPYARCIRPLSSRHSLSYV